jgi:Fe2+ or Zn2+ uptake regulation protein
MTVIKRQTKYCQSIEELMLKLGHATNSVLLSQLRKDYPNLSATTVHRATARLAERNIVSIAPSANDGSIRYDGNT